MGAGAGVPAVAAAATATGVVAVLVMAIWAGAWPACDRERPSFGTIAGRIVGRSDPWCDDDDTRLPGRLAGFEEVAVDGAPMLQSSECSSACSGLLDGFEDVGCEVADGSLAANEGFRSNFL